MSAPILVVEHPSYQRGFYKVVLDWVRVNLPESIALFDLQLLGPALRPQPHHRLMVPWLQDPVQAWSEDAYGQAMDLQARCDDAAIPVINRVEHLANAGKARGAALMREAGLRTPRMQAIQDASAFRDGAIHIPFPLFVREDWGHGGAMLEAADAAQARLLPLESFRRPVAVERIDLPDAHDALYRKYRYIIAGDRGVPHHLQASKEWVSRGENRVTNERTRQEELDYIDTPCPHHAMFLGAARQLGLDFVAFDYGLDACGQPVVWEANPFPLIQFSTKSLVYRNHAIHRTVAVMVALYMERAGLSLPAALEGKLSEQAPLRIG